VESESAYAETIIGFIADASAYFPGPISDTQQTLVRQPPFEPKANRSNKYI